MECHEKGILTEKDLDWLVDGNGREV